MIKTRYDYYQGKSEEYFTMSQHAKKDGNDELADKLHEEHLNYAKILDKKQGE